MQVADVGNEAQVEHAIGLIQHQHLGMAQVEDMLLEVVDERPGVPISTSMPSLELAGAASRSRCRRTPRRCFRSGVLAEDFRVMVDLHRQLAGRGDHQRANRGRSAAGGRRLREQRWYSATRKAAVLPVPVCAWPATSRPASAMGSVCAWIGRAYGKARRHGYLP